MRGSVAVALLVALAVTGQAIAAPSGQAGRVGAVENGLLVAVAGVAQPNAQSPLVRTAESAACTPLSDTVPSQAAVPEAINALDVKAEAAYAAKDWATAETLFREILLQAQASLGPNHLRTILASFDLGFAVFQRYDVADPHFAEAERLMRGYAEAKERMLGPHHVESGRAWFALAKLRRSSGDKAAALAAATHAQLILDAAVCPTGEVALQVLEFRAELVPTPDAPGLYTELYARRRSLAPQARETLAAETSAAWALSRAKRPKEAEPLYSDAEAQLSARFGVDDEDAVAARRNLGILLDNQERFKEAEPVLRAVRDSRRRKRGLDDPASLVAELDWADVVRKDGRPAEAEVAYRRVLGVREKALGPDAALTNAARLELADVVRVQPGRWQEAIDLARAALASAGHATPADTDVAGRASFILGLALQDAGSVAEAEPYLRQAAAERAKLYGDDSAAANQAQLHWRDALSSLHRHSEAASVGRAIHARSARLHGEGAEQTLKDANELALSLAKAGDAAGARAIVSRSKELAAAKGRDPQDAMLEEQREAFVLQALHDWPAAEAAWRRYTSLAEARYPPADPLIGLAHTGLAQTLIEQSHYAQAEAEYRLAADRLAVARGPDAAETLGARGRLAASVAIQGHNAEAVAIYRDLVARSRRIFGPASPATLRARENLAEALFEAGEQAQAVGELRQSYALDIQTFGAHSERALYGASALATYLSSTGSLKEAYDLADATYRMARLSLGPTHDTTLSIEGTLVTCLSALGRLGDALAEARRSLAAEQSVYGADAELTLVAQNNVAVLLQQTGALGEAERLDRATLATRQRVLGPRHPTTITSIANLAVDISKQDRFAEAEVFDRQALALRIEVFGPAHPMTLLSRSNLALTISLQNRPSESLAILREAYQLSRDALGAEHPETLQLLNNYAAMITDDAEAAALQETGYQAMRRVFGPDNPTSVNILANRGVRLGRLGRLAEAEAIDRQVLTLRTRILGADHPDTLRSSNDLAFELERARRWREAEPLLAATVALQARREAADPAEKLLTQGIVSRRMLGEARIELGDSPGAYSAFKAAASQARARYADRRVQSSESATGLLGAYKCTFTGQIRAGWAWAHQR